MREPAGHLPGSAGRLTRRPFGHRLNLIVERFELLPGDRGLERIGDYTARRHLLPSIRHGAFDGLARRFSSSGVPSRSEALETGDGFTGRLHRGPKRFVGARLSVPKSTQKPQSRGDATIAMSCWRGILRSGADPPAVAPNSNKRSLLSCLSISSDPPKKPRCWVIRAGRR